MDRIKDILNSIKDRISNPLIFSFLCSWAAINWQIMVALFWYDPKQIEAEGHKSIFEFIRSKNSAAYNFWIPLLIAIGYTFLMPLVKNLIRAFYSWVGKWGENWNLRIVKNGKISVDKYLGLRADYQKRTKELQDVIDQESAYLKDYSSLNDQFRILQNNTNETTRQFNEVTYYIQQHQNVLVLNGMWENSFEIENGGRGREDVFIENGDYYVVDATGEKKLTFKITDFYYDNRNNRVFFIKELMPREKQGRPKEEHFSINHLFMEGKDFLSGYENKTTKISYRRRG